MRLDARRYSVAWHQVLPFGRCGTRPAPAGIVPQHQHRCVIRAPPAAIAAARRRRANGRRGRGQSHAGYMRLLHTVREFAGRMAFRVFASGGFGPRVAPALQRRPVRGWRLAAPCGADQAPAASSRSADVDGRLARIAAAARQRANGQARDRAGRTLVTCARCARGARAPDGWRVAFRRRLDRAAAGAGTSATASSRQPGCCHRNRAAPVTCTTASSRGAGGDARFGRTARSRSPRRVGCARGARAPNGWRLALSTATRRAATGADATVSPGSHVAPVVHRADGARRFDGG